MIIVSFSLVVTAGSVWVDQEKVSNFEANYAFLDKIIGTGRNCKV